MPRPSIWLLPASLAAVAVALLTLPVAVSAAPPVVETFRDGRLAATSLTRVCSQAWQRA